MNIDPGTEATRQPWFPSNGSDGEMMTKAFDCENCRADINQECPLIRKSIVSEDRNIPEWTATSVYGHGLKCSSYNPID